MDGNGEEKIWLNVSSVELKLAHRRKDGK